MRTNTHNTTMEMTMAMKITRKKKQAPVAIETVDAPVTEVSAEPVSEVGAETIPADTIEQIADTHAGLPITEEKPMIAEDTVQLTAVAAPKKGSSTTVTVVLPCKGQSKAFLEVTIGDKQSWLAKDALTSFEIEDGMAVIEMPRTLARRRKLLEAA